MYHKYDSQIFLLLFCGLPFHAYVFKFLNCGKIHIKIYHFKLYNTIVLSAFSLEKNSDVLC